MKYDIFLNSLTTAPLINWLFHELGSLEVFFANLMPFESPIYLTCADIEQPFGDKHCTETDTNKVSGVQKVRNRARSGHAGCINMSSVKHALFQPAVAAGKLYMGAVRLILAAADIMWVDNCSTKPYVLMSDLAVGVLKALSAHSNARLFRRTLHPRRRSFCCAPPVLEQGVLERSHLWKTIKLSLWLPFVVSLSCGRSDKHNTSRCGFLRAYVRGELCSPVWVALVSESVLSSMRWIPFFLFCFLFFCIPPSS